MNIGANCNPLYVDFAKPAVLMTFQTLPPYGYSGIMGWTVPWQASLASKDIWLQAAWLDTNSKNLSLTSATLYPGVRQDLPDRSPITETRQALQEGMRLYPVLSGIFRRSGLCPAPLRARRSCGNRDTARCSSML